MNPTEFPEGCFLPSLLPQVGLGRSSSPTWRRSRDRQQTSEWWISNTHTVPSIQMEINIIYLHIFTYIWCFLMGNVSKWTIHWWFWDTYLNLLGKPKRLLIKAHGKFRRIFPGFFPAPLSFTKLGILRLPPFFPTKVDPYRKNRIQNKRQWKNQKIKC